MNYTSYKVDKNLSRQDILFAVARIPNSSKAYVAGSDLKIHEIDFANSKPDLRSFPAHSSYITALVLKDDTLVSGGYDGKLSWWKASTGEKIKTLDAHKRWIRQAALSSDGKLFASVADDMALRIWDIKDAKMVREMTGEHKPLTPNDFQSMLYACAFNSDGKLVATADKTGHIVVWETHTGKKVASMEAPIMYTWDPNARRHSIGGPRSLAFSPDSKLLAVGGTGKIGNIDHLEANGRIEVFNWEKSERIHEFVTDKSKGLVEHLEFHPEGNILLGAGGAGEGFLAFIDLKEKKVAHQEKAAMNIHAIASTDGMKSLLAVGHHKVLHFKMA